MKSKDYICGMMLRDLKLQPFVEIYRMRTMPSSPFVHVTDQNVSVIKDAASKKGVDINEQGKNV